jgi:hypothetical protein
MNDSERLWGGNAYHLHHVPWPLLFTAMELFWLTPFSFTCCMEIVCMIDLMQGLYPVHIQLAHMYSEQSKYVIEGVLVCVRPGRH